MKAAKQSFVVNAILKLLVCSALIIAASTKQQYSYYTFLRWLVMGAFIYFAYQSYEKKQFGLLIFFCLVAILFNPFVKFWFQRETWHLIDYLIALITLATLVYDWLQYRKTKRKKLSPAQMKLWQKLNQLSASRNRILDEKKQQDAK